VNRANPQGGREGKRGDWGENGGRLRRGGKVLRSQKEGKGMLGLILEGEKKCSIQENALSASGRGGRGGGSSPCTHEGSGGKGEEGVRPEGRARAMSEGRENPVYYEG